jgi:hypothetical protein
MTTFDAAFDAKQLEQRDVEAADWQHCTVNEIYHRMHACACQMRECAEILDWDVFCQHEQQMAQMVAHLKTRSDVTPRNASEKQERMTLIQTLLLIDSEIRYYTQPWLRQVNQWLNVNQQSQRMSHAYQTISQQI